MSSNQDSATPLLFLLFWIFFTVVGWFWAIILSFLTYDFVGLFVLAPILPDQLPAVLWIGTVTGETIGFWQRKYLLRFYRGWWIVVTNLGWTIGLSISALMLYNTLEVDNLSLIEILQHLSDRWYFGATTGSIVGLTQCLYLRRFSKNWLKLGVWVVTQSFTGILIAGLIADAFPNRLDDLWWVGITDGFFSGIVLAFGWRDVWYTPEEDS